MASMEEMAKLIEAQQKQLAEMQAAMAAMQAQQAAAARTFPTDLPAGARGQCGPNGCTSEAGDRHFPQRTGPWTEPPVAEDTPAIPARQQPPAKGKGKGDDAGKGKGKGGEGEEEAPDLQAITAELQQRDITLEGPVWQSPFFTSEFCDSFIGGSPLDGGPRLAMIQMMSVVFAELHATMQEVPGNCPYAGIIQRWDPENANVLREMSTLLREAEALVLLKDGDEAAGQGPAPDEWMAPIVGEWRRRIQELPMNDLMLFPGGWVDTKGNNAHVMHIIQRTGENSYAFVTCNAAAGDQGLQYHPGNVEQAPELKWKTAMKIRDVPAARMTCPVFLTMLIAQREAKEANRVEALYDAFLPWLGGVSLADAYEQSRRDNMAKYLPPCKSNTSALGSLQHALFYILRLKGFTNERICELNLVMRLHWMSKVSQELPPLAGEPAPAVQTNAWRAHLQGVQLRRNQPAPEFNAPPITAIYFSAHWCPPCRRFTPMLIHFYERARAANKPFNVIFVSRDKDPEMFEEYFRDMPWEAVPFEHQARREALAKHFKVDGIPKLIMLDPDGNIITKNGTQSVMQDPHAGRFPDGLAAPDGQAGGEDEQVQLTGTEVSLIGFAVRTSTSALLEESIAGRVPAATLSDSEDLLARIERQVVAAAIAKPGDAPAVFPNVDAENPTQPTYFTNMNLLVTSPDGKTEDDYRGERSRADPSPPVDLLQLPQRQQIVGVTEALEAIDIAHAIVNRLLSQANEQTATSDHTAKLLTATQLVSQLFITVLPVPDAGGVEAGCIWANTFRLSKDAQRRALKKLVNLIYLYGEVWQDIEEYTRPQDAQRALTVMAAFSIFDCLLRQEAIDGALPLTHMLRNGMQGGGLGISISLMMDQRGSQSIEDIAAGMELSSVQDALCRSQCLDYLTAVRQQCGPNRIFDLRLGPMGDYMAFSIDRFYGATLDFLEALLERLHLPPFPRGSSDNLTGALISWFGAGPGSDQPFDQLARLCPEWCMMRDMIVLFKYLFSMVPKHVENQLQARRGPNQAWRLSTDRTVDRVNRGMQDQGFQVNLIKVRGSAQNIADFMILGFRKRPIRWGDGMIFRSPASLTKLMGKERVTEEDILHEEDLERFDNVLSSEESEKLLCPLTVPYLRLPLTAAFFADLQPDVHDPDRLACGNRVCFLFNTKLQDLFRAIVLEGGHWVPFSEEQSGLIDRVPMRRTREQESTFQQLRAQDARVEEERQCLGTPLSALLAEFEHSPEATMRPMIEMVRFIEEIAGVSVHSEAAAFVLNLIEITVYVQRQLLGALKTAEAGGPGARLAKNADMLRTLSTELNAVVESARRCVEHWLEEAEAEVSADGLRTKNYATMAVLHSYLALLASNRLRSDMNIEAVTSFMKSLAFVRSNHTFGQKLKLLALSAEDQLDPKKLEEALRDVLAKFLQGEGVAPNDARADNLKRYCTGEPLFFYRGAEVVRVPMPTIDKRTRGFASPPTEVPESHLLYVLQNIRMSVVTWLAGQPVTDRATTLSTIVQHALGKPNFRCENWEAGAGSPVGVYSTVGYETKVTVNLQHAEVLFQDARIRPVPEAIASDGDFEHVFGKESLQCAFRFENQHRLWVDVVGEDHELLWWDQPGWEDMGVGAPFPAPYHAFEPDNTAAPGGSRGPPAQRVLTTLQGRLRNLKSKQTNMPVGQEVWGDKELLGIYFSAHWCGPCRQFTPALAGLYNRLNADGVRMEVVWVPTDRDCTSLATYNAYYREMPWLALPMEARAAREELMQLFAVRGFPTLVFVDPRTGHVVSMDGRSKVARDPQGARFPWRANPAEAAPQPQVQAGARPGYITYCEERYSRPFVWAFDPQAPPPDPREETFVRSALYALKATKLDEMVLFYMPTEVAPENTKVVRLIGMMEERDEDEEVPEDAPPPPPIWGTWKEVEVHLEWGVAFVYNLLSHGRRMYRSLMWASNTRLSLHSITSDVQKDRKVPPVDFLREMGGDAKGRVDPGKSLVICRENFDIFGRETWLPNRLLSGLIPSALLEGFRFWIGEDQMLRGYPRNLNDEWFNYYLIVRLDTEARTATVYRMEGSETDFGQVPFRPMKEQPDLQKAHSSTLFNGEVSQSGRHTEMLNSVAGLARATSRLKRTLSTKKISEELDLTPLQGRGFSDAAIREVLIRARTGAGHVDYDLALQYLEQGTPAAESHPEGLSLSRAASAAGGVSGDASKFSRQDADFADCTRLVSWLDAPRDSDLFQLGHSLSNVEDLSHCMAWVDGQGRLQQVELPRLKLRLRPKKNKDLESRLYCVDHAGWFLSKQLETSEGARKEYLTKVLSGLPHGLLLEDDEGQLQVLVPNHPVWQEKNQSDVFGTKLVLDRTSSRWTETCDIRYYLYKVHTSAQFLLTPDLDSLLFLILLRALHREYAQSASLCDALTVDVELGAMEQYVLDLYMKWNDGVPDAQALRVKLLAALQYGEPTNFSHVFDAGRVLDRYLVLISQVSGHCKITPTEELSALKHAKSQTHRVKCRKACLEAIASGANVAEVTEPTPKLGGQVWSIVKEASREFLTTGNEIHSYMYVPPNEETPNQLADEVAADILVKGDLLEDQESGMSRQLGFLFLYQLLRGQISLEFQGENHARLGASLLTRYFQLKLAFWGTGLAQGEGAGSALKPGRGMATLLMVMEFPDAAWPEVPTDEGTMELLSAGFSPETILNNPEHENAAAAQPLMDFFEQLNRRFTECTESPERERTMQNERLRSRRIGAVLYQVPPVEVHVAWPHRSLRAPAVTDSSSNRRLLPALAQFQSLAPFACLNLNDNFLQTVTLPTAQARLASLKLATSVGEHSQSKSPIAKELIQRMDADIQLYASYTSRPDQKATHLKGLLPEDIDRYLQSGAGGTFAEVLANLDRLMTDLKNLRNQDRASMSQGIEGALESMNAVPGNGEDERRFRLRQAAGLAPKLTYSFVCQSLMSSMCVQDIQSVNRYATHGVIEEGLHRIVLAMLLSIRVSFIGRAIAALHKVVSSVKKMHDGVPNLDGRNIKQECKTLVMWLTMPRYSSQVAGDAVSMDPRFLVFEYVFDLMLRQRQVEMVNDFLGASSGGLSLCQQMIMGAGKTTVVGPMLALCLADGNRLFMMTCPSALLVFARSVMRGIFTTPLLPKKIYTMNFERQCENDVSIIESILDKINSARSERGVLCSRPECIKSLLLKFIEQLHWVEKHGEAWSNMKSVGAFGNKDLADALGDLKERAIMGDKIVKVADIWKNAFIVMDEVDVLLHPLRSELNFPIGLKDPIDLSGDRWQLPLFLLEALMLLQDPHRGPLDTVLRSWVEVDPSDWGPAEDRCGLKLLQLWKDLEKTIEKGKTSNAFLQSPHLVLLSPGFYETELKPVVAQLALLWVYNSSTNLELPLASILLDYLKGGRDSLEKKLAAEPGCVTSFSMKLLNLARDWVTSLYPHVTSKINRVSFGLLADDDYAQTESRRLLAVPFVGKDVPSKSSEFAHPDVLLGLSILAYRYEGLRRFDTRSITKRLKADFAKEAGQKLDRPSFITFTNWKAAGRKFLADHDRPSVSGILGLDLFQPEDPAQLIHVHNLFKNLPMVIFNYLRSTVFPKTMQFQGMKISGCGHELGSDILFGTRFGFSGTPSSLMPADLGKCKYEEKTEGELLDVLTNPIIMSTKLIGNTQEGTWTAKSLLMAIAQASPGFHALIDVGALVTGYENHEVAELLLENLPDWYEGVIYLDRQDRKMMLLRRSWRSMPEAQCGVAWDRRFTFYDQVHTTGMDIKQFSQARAVITVGKDTTWRDYAQGAYRMRGIGKGQCLQLFLVPEIAQRVKSELSLIPGLLKVKPNGNPESDADLEWEHNTVMWLLINSMRMETLQFLQLKFQELFCIYRKGGLKVLMDDARPRSSEAIKRFDGNDRLKTAINIFREPISFEVPNTIPPVQTLVQAMRDCIERWDGEMKLGHRLLLPSGPAAVQKVLDEAASLGEGGDMTQDKEGEREVEAEKEEETTIQKEAEEEQQKMSQFDRTEENPIAWKASKLERVPPTLSLHVSGGMDNMADSCKTFSNMVFGDDPFFTLQVLQVDEKCPALGPTIPHQVLISSNFFRPRWATMGQRRMKNVTLILEWKPSGSEGLPYFAIVTLGEAETLRRLLHLGFYGVRAGHRKTMAELQAKIALRTPRGMVLDKCQGYEPASSQDAMAIFQLLRFFNNDMFFAPEEIKLLLGIIGGIDLETRRQFFSQLIAKRRRDKVDTLGTPVAQVFMTTEEWTYANARGMIEGAKKALAHKFGVLKVTHTKLREAQAEMENFQTSYETREQYEERQMMAQIQIMECQEILDKEPNTVEDYFDLYKNEDGVMGRSELEKFFGEVSRIHPKGGDLAHIMEMGGCEKTQEMTKEVFSELFEVKAPEGEVVKVEAAKEPDPWPCPNERCIYRISMGANGDIFMNPGGATHCLYCECPKSDAPVAVVAPPGYWACPKTTFFNPNSSYFCDCCGAPKPS